MVVTIRAVAVGGPEKWKDPEYYFEGGANMVSGTNRLCERKI